MGPVVHRAVAESPDADARRDSSSLGRKVPRKGPRSRLCWPTVFMTYAFDTWMTREHPGCPFERYADDIVVHCDTEMQARRLWVEIAKRLKTVGLELHPEKTKVVYCKDANRRGESEHTSFDFLGYTFRGREARGPRGYFMSFAPAIAPTARKALSQTIRAWHLRRRSTSDLSSIARGNKPAGARLARLLRSLLSLRAALPRLAHRSASRSMGQAQVQTTQVHPRQCMGLAGRRQTARAGTIRALAGSAGTEGSTCKSRMTGDCHVRCARDMTSSSGVRVPCGG